MSGHSCIPNRQLSFHIFSSACYRLLSEYLLSAPCVPHSPLGIPKHVVTLLVTMADGDLSHCIWVDQVTLCEAALVRIKTQKNKKTTHNFFSFV